MPVSPSDLQPELLFTENPTSEMRFAARQMAQVQRELAQRNRHILRTAGRWLDLYDYVKMLENDHLCASDHVTGQLQLFRGTTSIVHGLGTLLLAKLQNDDAEQLKALGLTYRDLAACIEEIGDIDRALNGDMTPAMVTEMNTRLFDSGQLS